MSHGHVHPNSNGAQHHACSHQLPSQPKRRWRGGVDREVVNGEGHCGGRGARGFFEGGLLGDGRGVSVWGGDLMGGERYRCFWLVGQHAPKRGNMPALTTCTYPLAFVVGLMQFVVGLSTTESVNCTHSQSTLTLSQLSQ